MTYNQLNSMVFVVLLAALLIEVLYRWQVLPCEPVEVQPRPSCSVFPQAAGPPGRSVWECYEFRLERPEGME